MDIARVNGLLNQTIAGSFDFYERRSGDYQLIVPLFHEDGDMIDIYLQDSPEGEGYVRICDFGLAQMRLSYTYEVNTPSRQQIFDSILFNSGVSNDAGNIYLDTRIEKLYEGILQFAGCIQKVCNMRYWSREVVRSSFYDDLEEYITTSLTRFSPVPDESPLSDYPVSVDWSLSHHDRNFYVFGVRGNDKAKNVAISLLEFQKAQLPFISLVVHENMDEIGKKEASYLTRNADVQYPILSHFVERADADINRIAGAA